MQAVQSTPRITVSQTVARLVKEGYPLGKAVSKALREMRVRKGKDM